MPPEKTGVVTFSTYKLAFLDNILVKIGRQTLIDSWVILIIKYYQKYLSPQKGFSCAYRKLYQAESCSEYFKQIIIRDGLTEAIPLFQQRLLDCRRASATLQSNSNNQKRKRTKKHHEPDECERCSDCLLWLELPTTISDCDVCDFDSVGCGDGGCDVGGCDFS